MARNAAWLDAQDDAVARAAIERVGASLMRSDMNGDIAYGQVTQHAAHTALVTSDDVYDDDRRSDGGAVDTTLVALDDIEVWVFTPEGIPVMDVEATLALRSDLNAPRLTWLERIARRWPARAS